MCMQFSNGPFCSGNCSWDVANSFYKCLCVRIKKQRHRLPTKVGIVQSVVFPVVMLGCESWIIKKAEELMLSNCGAETTLESPLDTKEIKSVNPKGNQPWLFIERTDAEPEAPILWPPDVKSQLIGKDPDAGVTEDEMVGWHHRLDRHEIVGDRGAWRASVHGIAKSWTQLSF